MLFKLLSHKYPICTLSVKLTSSNTKARNDEISLSYCLRMLCCVRLRLS